MVNLFFAFLLLCSFQRSIMVGLTRLELVTSRLSGVRSNQLSYRPIYGGDEEIRTPDPLLARQVLSQLSYTPIYREIFSQNQTMLECARHMPLPQQRMLLRKEVIQPHLPIRLPCYDFTPIIAPTLDGRYHRPLAGFGCE